ncbi:hypothetical protein HPB51_019667 [Rhipicephalus microplus]|uniref:Abc transporter c family member n=1 Tax=Rhipicephalus microplus TaxID=6941 RepID=A0A9J6EC57_RHIMP|nr:hypothetical protein HPB51_019667 [Rhipicephalus microplus]
MDVRDNQALFLSVACLGFARGCFTLESGIREDSVLLASLLDATCDFALALSCVIAFNHNSMSRSDVILTYLLAVCTAGNFVCAGIHDHVISLRPPTVHVHQGYLNEDSVSVFSKIACLCLFPKRRRQPLSAKTFLSNVLKVLWIDILRLALCTLAYFSCIFARVPALELLIRTSGTSGRTIASLLFMVTCVGEWLISSYHMELLLFTGCRLRSLLQGIVFIKATLQSPASAQPVGYVASLLGVDCLQLCYGFYALPLPLFGTLTLPLLFWMLSKMVGVAPAVCCATWAVITILAPLVFLYAQRYFWDGHIEARDERLKFMTDLLCNIRVVKMYAWEDALQQNVLKSRKLELKSLLRVNFLAAVLDSVCSSCSTVMMIILFSTMSMLEPDRVLSPELSFSCILGAVNLFVEKLITSAFQGSLSLKRISSFCTAEEYDEEKMSRAQDYFTKTGSVSLKNCTLAWSSPARKGEEPQLKSVTLDVEPGSLVGVVGFVGSGKSSLLSAILGDMRCLEGSVTSAGRIAYVPQLPSVHNMSIRDNILYGRPMHPAYYERVLHCCQLMNDLNKIPAGDAAEVGEKGTNLSGGQKQRISLARAAYSASDIYLLDEPLCSLDPMVANGVFRDVIGQSGILRDKTSWLLLEGLIRFTPWQAPMGVALLVTAAAAQAMQQIWIKSWTDASTVDSDAVTGSRRYWIGVLVGICVANGGHCMINRKPLVVYVKSSSELKRGSVVEYVIATQRARVRFLLEPSLKCFFTVLCRLLGGLLLAATARLMSDSLHRAMLDGVLRSPVSFFDASPRGRVLNRFAADLDFVDEESFASGHQCIQGSLLTVASVAVVATQAPLVVAVTAVVAVLVASGFVAAVSRSHSSRYVDSVGLSKLLQHMTETLESLSSVRAYGVVDRFRRHFFRLSDVSLRGFSSYCACYRFTRSLMAVGGFAVVVFSLLLSTVGSTASDPSSLGLVLSSATSVPLLLMTLCLKLFSLLQMVVSFEHCIDYTELPPEVTVLFHSSVCIRIKNKLGMERIPCDLVTAGPETGLTMLKTSAKLCEKVGVVGRTGAGKSSLVLALLRILRASKGCILIDGVDIAQVPLKKLRRAITIIPQDPSLVRGTLRVNLDPTRVHSDEQLWQVLRQVHLSPLVKGHPAGLDMETADGGANLSVGQRQLVCLARALLRGSKIVLLDEATSQMDGDTDHLIQTTLREAFAKSTLIAIAHRLHTVLDYDRILVMDKGKVKEYDTPASLLSNPESAFFKMAASAGVSAQRKSHPLDATSL